MGFDEKVDELFGFLENVGESTDNVNRKIALTWREKLGFSVTSLRRNLYGVGALAHSYVTATPGLAPTIGGTILTFYMGYKALDSNLGTDNEFAFLKKDNGANHESIPVYSAIIYTVGAGSLSYGLVKLGVAISNKDNSQMYESIRYIGFGLGTILLGSAERMSDKEYHDATPPKK